MSAVPGTSPRGPASRPEADGGRSDLHVVAGTGGAVGRLVAAHLHAAGVRVRAVTRDGRDVGTPGVERVAADADAAALTAACRGAVAVHHCVMPVSTRWTEQFMVVTDALVDAAGTVGARPVYADDTSMYGRVGAPMTEDTPWRPVSGRGVLRAWLAERLLHAAASGWLRVSIARAGELYGPGVRSLIAGNVFRPALQGRPVHWIGDPDLPLTPTFVDDFARTVAVLGLRDTADAAVWHVPHPGRTTGRQLAAEACRQAGTRLQSLRHGHRQARALGWFVPLVREGAEPVHRFEQPFEVDGSRARTAFGVIPTPYEDGVGRTSPHSVRPIDDGRPLPLGWVRR